MAQVVWEYVMKWDVFSTFKMPVGTKILACQVQSPSICLWAECNDDPTREQETRSFRIYGTGDKFQSDLSHEYVGTVQMGSFVWHVYEVKPI